MRWAWCFVGILVSLCVAVTAQQPIDPDAARQRLELVAAGSYQIGLQGASPPGPDDVGLCCRALAHADVGLKVAACRAVAHMASIPFFRDLPPAQRHELAVLLIAELGGEHGPLADAAGHSVRRLVYSDGLLERRDLHSAIVQALGMAQDDDVEVRRRAGLLLAEIAARGDENIRQQVARTVLMALERYPAKRDDGEREEIARALLRTVLTRFETVDSKLADDLAALFLADLASGEEWGFRYGRSDALRGLGHVFNALRQPLRGAAFGALRDCVGAEDLQFMTTSGMRSPQRHHAHEALAFAARGFTMAELEAIEELASAARQRDEAAGMDDMDVRGIYETLETCLRDRRKQLKR